MRIEPLTEHADLAQTLADWHIEEFGHLYDPAVWNREIAVNELESMASAGSRDLTLVAFEPDRGTDGTDGDLLGSVSLIGTDDLPGFDHLSPWLASLFVTPAARGRGVGAQLVDAAIEAAARRGDPYVHLFTAGQEEYYLARGWRTIANIDHRGHAAVVMARATSPRGARRAVSSHWCNDADTNGAYSYLRIGGRPEHRDVLTSKILPSLWFAGEATSRAYPATMHGAWFSGERAADAVLAHAGAQTVLVVGAGISGMVAARRLHERGRIVTVVESKRQAGGRITTDTSLGVPLPLGGAWLHGEIGHPLAPLVTFAEEEWSDRTSFVIGHGQLTVAEVAELRTAFESVHAHFAASAPDVSVEQALHEALDAMPDLDPSVRAALVSRIVAETESLYAAPVGDIAANGGFEPYELPGDDRLITSSLADVIDHLAGGLDIRFDHRVHRLQLEASADDARWVATTDDGAMFDADAVIVTIPIGALRTDRIEFAPPLPDDVRDAIDHLGAGPVTKLFTTYDSRWWPLDRPIRIGGHSELLALTDMTDLTDSPTLCWFATGDAARRIEELSEHEQCLLADRVADECGLTSWDT